ncbi:MAG: 2-C-methyl-D-erythritol 4-phosphate cytidylyltransferase, partial [Bacteroidaceae bacterium]|nr:2-C-methyl-D-erythritol 4-phosphate cytidylyltransferase [Bacteroidaceae bacterium]
VLILVLPALQQSYWKELCYQHRFTLPYILADGGPTRFHSVRNGLAAVPDDAQGVVGIHDGVRPFVATEVVRRCMSEAVEKGAVIPVLPVVDTIRQLSNGKSQTVRREEYCRVQTPQAFRIEIIKKAYLQEYTPTFTDDASVVEAENVQVSLVDGNPENIKITTPFDKAVGEMLIQSGMNV